MTFLLVNFAVKNATVFFPFLLSRTGLTISVSLFARLRRSAVQPSLQCSATAPAVHCIRPCSALHSPRKYVQPFPQVLATILARTCDRP